MDERVPRSSRGTPRLSSRCCLVGTTRGEKAGRKEPKTARRELMNPRRHARRQRPQGLDPIVAEIIEALVDCIIWKEDRRARSKEHPVMDSNE